MPQKSLILITEGFPFGESEQSFLRREFDELVKRYQVTLLAKKTDEPIKYPIPDSVSVEQYASRSNSGKQLLAALPQFISALLKPHVLKELLSALRGCSFRLKKQRLKELISVAVQVEQLKSVLVPLIEKHNADFIYSYWCRPIILSAAELKQKYPNLKVLTRFHGIDLYNERTTSGWQPFRTAISEKCDRLVFACETGRDYYLAHWGQKWAKKSIVSYLGCAPLARISAQKSDCLTMVSCSNAIPLKRIHLIIEALALLPGEIRVDWHHIGDGIELGNLKQMAGNRLAAHINISWKFWGYISNHQLNVVYQDVQPDLFITLTETEGGAPVSIQEIFSMGVPAIGTAVGGIPEQVQTGKTGYLLSADPPPVEVCKAIVDFYNAELELRQAMCDAAYALWQEKFDAKANAIRFVEMLADMAE